MGEAFYVAGQIYLLGFVIAMGMAGLIKLMLILIRRSEGKAAVQAAAQTAAQAKNGNGGAL